MDSIAKGKYNHQKKKNCNKMLYITVKQMAKNTVKQLVGSTKTCIISSTVYIFSKYTYILPQLHIHISDFELKIESQIRRKNWKI